MKKRLENKYKINELFEDKDSRTMENEKSNYTRKKDVKLWMK